ncbi:DUF4345 domain-containing protein [Acinetobacter nematophilus]|uniref:DUF4345 domain-containing protein n=1 Tax=Acinetobacter nematophilus TaxID=2994642 RepID=A0A9X3DU17_9GAMM|nr:DUF4345 domain-containing protein [Acinetobacter nematophilus]MCX5468510.1 DUF4345 domain-containing protein [Acinetobacter nematophilus]
MTKIRSDKILLAIAATGLIPIALSYGLMPEKTLNILYKINVDNINLKHIMRAVTGLYFGQIVMWFLGASYERLTRPALYCLVVFMLGLAFGRIASFFVDGIPHFLLIVYFLLELIIGLIGLKFILEHKHKI